MKSETLLSVKTEQHLQMRASSKHIVFCLMFLRCLEKPALFRQSDSDDTTV